MNQIVNQSPASIHSSMIVLYQRIYDILCFVGNRDMFKGVNVVFYL